MRLEYFSNIVHDSVHDVSPSYKLTKFPPPDDFPMVTDLSGKVVSRYKDAYYNYSVICGRPLIIGFESTPRSKFPIAPENGNFLRLFTAYLQYGEVGNLSPGTMKKHVTALRKIIYFCESRGIGFQDLYRYPNVQQDLSRWWAENAPSNGDRLLETLKKINCGCQTLGFNIFNSEGLSRFQSYLDVSHESVQTAYIPLRIWSYQLGRLSYFLQKYLDHQDIFEKMFREMLSAYLKNCGSIELATRSGRIRKSPFSTKSISNSRVYLGSFPDYARRMNVLEVISELVYAQPSGQISLNAGAKPFGRYLNSLCFIAQIFLINFSGMRVSEAAGLRSNAFYQDEIGGETVCLLKGATKKTLRNDNALWITSKVAEMAVRVMTSISKLRMEIASLDSRVPTSADELDNPYLFVYGYEPWLPSKKTNAEREMSIRSWLSYSQWRGRCPGLFEENSITITSADLNEALSVTPNLNVDIYDVGKPWPFAYHQLRRTLYVNASNSGVVSEYSGQWQLKHYYLNMSRHYGRNYSSLGLNSGVGVEFLVELHKQLASKALELDEDNYVSLLSEKHKKTVLRFLQLGDVKKLLKLVKEGKFSFRKNLLGLCFSTSPCQYGGFDNIVNCATCTEGLVDKRNLSKLERFIKLVEFELEHEHAESPRFESLQAQHRVALNAIEVVTIE